MNSKGTVTLVNLYSRIRDCLQEENPAEDRSGRTQLQIIADYVGSLRPETSELDDFVAVALRLVEEIPALTDVEVTRLTKFVLSMKSLPTTLAEPAQRLLRESQRQLSPSKRADVMAMLRRFGRRFLPKELEQDIAMRQARPWLWFDLALTSAPEVAFAALPELASYENFFPAMLSRLVRIWRTDGTMFRDFFAKLEPCLTPAQKRQCTEYLNNYDIKPRSNEPRDIADFDSFAQKFTSQRPIYNAVTT